MSLQLDNRIAAEELQLAIFEVIQANINDYIGTEESHGNDLDTRVAVAGGRDPSFVELERFDARYIHYGHRPSMIESPVTEYPSMSIMSFLATPGTANMLADYGHTMSIRCAIEFIVKSGPYAPDDRAGVGEDIVGRRAKRTAEAVFRLMDDNRDLGQNFLPPEMPPTVTWGEIFEREEDGMNVLGARWYWQGVRIEYTYLKQTVFGVN